jgi:putative membrane protein
VSPPQRAVVADEQSVGLGRPDEFLPPDDVVLPDVALDLPPDVPPLEPVRGRRRLVLVVHGALIGAVEIIPGVSGGTVALILGVYETIIRSAGHLVRGLLGGGRAVLRGGDRAPARAQFAQVRWDALAPLGAGMIVAIVVGARLLEPAMAAYPVQARALFAGLMLASLVVPARMVGGRWTAREVLLGGLAAAAAFLLTGLPPLAEQAPPMPVVTLAGALAVCALVLPGISGSFLLLSIGMYAPTISAVNDLDLGYLGALALGAAVGLGMFVVGLQWLLEHRRRVTLVVMTGLMAGALRALWPWQDADRHLLPVGAGAWSAAALCLAGALLVTALLLAHGRVAQRNGTNR